MDPPRPNRQGEEPMTRRYWVVLIVAAALALAGMAAFVVGA
jgi:hypothetical protein